MIQVSPIQSENDRRASRQIREVVFIVEQQVPQEIEYDEYEESSTHILATLNGLPAGTARWRQTEHGQKLERFAVLKSARGKGVGAALVQYILEQLNETESVYLNSQLSAIPFYAHFGFEETGGIFYEANIPHRKMVLKTIRSI
ncbi:MAG: GNAT family N-acetyltransferase [Candidatus Marinimicrobia bacterium]|nr:GNAT family N-acetyltransferase [Candidatus Neomarinimicrobiota bacterium]MCF7921685.1 GNAT family N-acetyltransferase [Candidatus Neomarinimicrobiota bacterium]